MHFCGLPDSKIQLLFVQGQLGCCVVDYLTNQTSSHFKSNSIIFLPIFVDNILKAAILKSRNVKFDKCNVEAMPKCLFSLEAIFIEHNCI